MSITSVIFKHPLIIQLHPDVAYYLFINHKYINTFSVFFFLISHMSDLDRKKAKWHFMLCVNRFPTKQCIFDIIFSEQILSFILYIYINLSLFYFYLFSYTFSDHTFISIHNKLCIIYI